MKSLSELNDANKAFWGGDTGSVGRATDGFDAGRVVNTRTPVGPLKVHKGYLNHQDPSPQGMKIFPDKGAAQAEAAALQAKYGGEYKFEWGNMGHRVIIAVYKGGKFMGNLAE